MQLQQLSTRPYNNLRAITTVHLDIDHTMIPKTKTAALSVTAKDQLGVTMGLDSAAIEYVSSNPAHRLCSGWSRYSKRDRQCGYYGTSNDGQWPGNKIKYHHGTSSVDIRKCNRYV